MLRVNEIFGPTIQGEGKTAGKEVLFLRLSGCNLHCVWCDTPYTWNWVGTKHTHPKKFEFKSESHEMSQAQVIAKLMELSNDKVRALVISGGEPLLQQGNLIPIIHTLKQLGWWVEVETNGTIAPTNLFLELIDQINCSPKLSNNGADLKQNRMRPDALEKLSGSLKTTFKFVVSRQEDIDEIIEYVTMYFMHQVYLMPLGMTVNELALTRQVTQELAAKLNFQFSERLHVMQFGGIRGV